MPGLYDMEPMERPEAVSPSPARLHVREHFADIEAARKRGVLWTQIIAVMAEAGLRNAKGGPLTVGQARALFHAEQTTRAMREARERNSAVREARRAARGGGRQVREHRPEAAPTVAAVQPGTVVADDAEDAGPQDRRAGADSEAQGRSLPGSAPTVDAAPVGTVAEVARGHSADPMTVPLVEPPPKPAGLFGRWARPGGGRDA